MQYKKTFLLLVLALCFSGISSCKKWLNVTPATQTSEDEQFSSRQGFIDVLWGVYAKMSDVDSYGGNLSYGFLDVLAQRYENKSSTTDWYGEAARYHYTESGGSVLDVRQTIHDIWQSSYASIAQVNYILDNIDRHKDLLGGTTYNIIKGEALALRGFLHFDLLRMFAPAYLNGQHAKTPAIPYMKDFTVVPQAKNTEDEVLTLCEADLKEAEQLLAAYPDIDQIAGNQGSTATDLFLMFRQNHLNYWAVKATLARLYQFKEDDANALKYATAVIDGGEFRFITQSEINTDPTSVDADLTFTPEHIFSLYNSDLKEIADDYFKSTSTTAGDATDLFSRRTRLNDLYEVSTTGYGTDLRSPAASQSLWSQLSASVVYTKKYYTDNPSNVKEKLIPIIKLSEMYYIAAAAAPTPQEGVKYLNTVRQARLIPLLPADTDEETLQAELQKAYRKEFYGEGQLWFYYKRNNIVNIPGGIGNPMTEKKYVFPEPLDEIEFGK